MPTKPPQVRLPTSRPEFGLLEQPRQRVAAGARVLIGDHHLRPVDARIRRVLDDPIARRPIRLDVARQDFDKVVGHLPAGIEPLVDDRSLLVGLRKVVAVKVGKPLVAGVGQVHIGQLAAGKLIYLSPVTLDPVDVAQAGFVLERESRRYRARFSRLPRQCASWLPGSRFPQAAAECLWPPSDPRC